MRLFVAMELPEGVLSRIEEWEKPLLPSYPGLKWTSRNNMHLTLRFFGESDPILMESEIKKLHLEECLPVKFTIDRSGTFGRPPSILWLGGRFSRGVTEAALLLGGIPDAWGNTGNERFTPHITLARARAGHEVHRIPFRLELEGESTSICLFSSTLTPSGPVYRRLFEAGY